MQQISILSPPVVTRVMQESQNSLTLPMDLMWYARANMPNVSDDEMTLKYKNYVFAADVVTEDSEPHIRQAGEFGFQQYGSGKLKHGFGINEKMLRLLQRAGKNMAMDNEILGLQGYLKTQAMNLELGARQRVETLINAMLADGYAYNRLGLKISGTWGMPADLKFNPVAPWRNNDGTVNVNATPTTDVINCLFSASRNHSEKYNRITLSFAALQAWVGSTEFQNIYQANAFSYQQTTNDTTRAQAGNPFFYLDFIGDFLSNSMRKTSSNGMAQNPRRVQIEVNDGSYREYSEGENPLANGLTPFQPGQGTLLFTNTEDDNNSQGWDVGNGECIEGLVASFGGSAIIEKEAFNSMGNFYGPLGYTTPADVYLKKPGLVMWNVRWCSPRKHRDTCSAKLTAYTP